MLICLEGIEGSGKSTQCKILVDRLEREGYEAVYMREPGGTSIGEQIRSILLMPGNDMDVRTEAFLFMAARAQLFVEKIRPAMHAGKIIVIDRWAWSTFAYQGTSPLMESMTDFACYKQWPTMTFLLDLSVEAGRARIVEKHKDRMEQKSIKFHETVRSNYLILAERFDHKITKVAADNPVEGVAAYIWNFVKEKL